jgi:hypothetical protein
MPPKSDEWHMPERWLWVDYPLGWLGIFAWVGKADWPGGNDSIRDFEWPVLQVRMVVRERHFYKTFNSDNPELLDIEFTPLPGIRVVSLMSKEAPERLAAMVSVARSCGHSWATIGDILGVGRTAAHKRFGSEPSSKAHPSYSERSAEQILVEIADHLVFERAINSVLRDLVVQARCDGLAWAQIGDALGVGLTAAQKRFGQGLTRERVNQLDQELLWMNQLAPTGEEGLRYRSRLALRRQTRIALRRTGSPGS